MIRLLFLILLLGLTKVGMSQSPQAFKYQSVIRNIDGTVLSEQNINLRISILQGDIASLSTYSEVHSKQTNPFGLINLIIGKGEVKSGNFSEIKWGEDEYFVQIEVDVNGGTEYSLLGTSQLLSVPYALYANNASNVKWKENENKGLFYNEGKVGIGTSNPAYDLHVENLTSPGGVFLRGNSNAGWARLQLFSNGITQYGELGGHIQLQATGNNVNKFFIVNLDNRAGLFPDVQGANFSTNSSGGFNFFTGEDNNTIHRMSLTSTGNLGIGVTNPMRKLHISDAIRLEPLSSRPINPVQGDLYFGTDRKLHLFDGTTWNILSMTPE